MSIKCNNDINTATEFSKFIFFGCWNNINCKSEYIYRNMVLDYITKNEKDVKQIYIAGDNWYTNKKKINEEEFKLYFTEILRTGYDKLYRMNKEIYIAVGNHDIDTDISDNDKSKSKSATNPLSLITENNLKKDCNINTQKYYLQKIKELADSKNYDEISVPTLELLQEKNSELSEDKLCEKGIYIYVENIGVRYNADNIIIIINTNKFDDIKTGESYLQDIMKVIKDVDKEKAKKGGTEQIFVMGHIPLFTYKKDKIAIHEINKKKKEYRKIIVDLFNIFVEYNIIYLCADTHNFSIMKITHNGRELIQITAGTGGADPDIIKGDFAITPINFIENVVIGDENARTYEITAYALNSYGYVTVEIYKKYIDVKYTQIITDKKELLDVPYLMKMQSFSAPNNNINSQYTNKKTIHHKGSLGSLSISRATTQVNKKQDKIRKINYKITRNIVDVKYVNKVVEKSNFMNNPIYKNKIICKNIKTNPMGYITDKSNNLLCYKKAVNKDK
jgi:hypothetical protein